MVDAARPCRHAPGDLWCVDETYVKVAGRWVYLYRAIDQYGQVIDVLVSEKRDLAATRRFFARALTHGPRPTEVSTDRAPAYARVLDELLPSVRHVVERIQGRRPAAGIVNATDNVVLPRYAGRAARHRLPYMYVHTSRRAR